MAPLTPSLLPYPVTQEVEYVKEEAKLSYLLECLQKTAPPVLVFAENKADVDAVHEFLLVKVCQEAASLLYCLGPLPAVLPRLPPCCTA